MKRLYLIRHAKSSWEDPMLKDINRPLNKRGLRDAPFMAKLLKGKGVVPEKIVSSPANRAITTASYFAGEFGISKEEIEVVKKVYEAYTEDILEVVQTQFLEEWNTVFLFGHNPTFTSFANLFSDEYIANVPTCGICELVLTQGKWLDFDEGKVRLTAFYYPKQFFS